ncbi:MAG: HAMP domain-containing sensor histidine kinase [Arachidicoccus sp.]|nr:HAMP domain-containing sensor histidine kinase [Arachidicoccus sp.]
MKKSKRYIALLLVILAATAIAAALLFIFHYNLAGSIITVIFFITVLFLYKIIKDIYRDFADFVEALRYRDFSQRFSVEHSPKHLKIFRSGFNTIAEEYKKLSFEKTAQFHYLQNVLEMVDTGIMAYDIASGEVIWINQLMKDYLRPPSLKNIQLLKKYAPKIFAEIVAMPVKEQKVITVTRPEDELKLLLAASTFSAQEKTFKLIAVQKVDETLDISESEAWKKLLRVLTHEIMNSIAPISSVATTLQSRLNNVEHSGILTDNDFQDFKDGIATIKSRSNGLLKFAESYRNLNKIGSLNSSVFYLHDLFESLLTLMSPMMEQRNISFEIILKNPTLEIEADRELLEQLLINLLLNAADAVKDKDEKRVLLIGEWHEKLKPIIKVSDNGNGMDKEMIDKIFIPFFTTKKTGSGIGLSLCKQIMLLHKGSIHVKSTVGKGTVFSLHF